MDGDFQTLSQMLTDIWAVIVNQAESFLLPTRLMQLGILLGCFVLAWLIDRWISPKMRDWMRDLEGWPKWRLRLLVLLQRRLRLIFFASFSWIAVWCIQATTVFRTRWFIVELVASIAVAWLAVSLTTRLVRNAFLRQVITWGLWIYVTLYYLNLTEPTAQVLDGAALELGEFRLSLLTLLNAVVVTGVLFTLARFASGAASTGIRKNEHISPSMRVLLVKLTQVVLFSAAFFIGLKAVGFDLTGLAVLSGAIGVGLGFGLQKVVSNLVSGVIILLDKSVKPGDVISLGETFGWINALGARYVSITTRDGKEYLIPNEDLITGQVVNWSHTNNFVRLDIFFGTSYHDDPHQVRELAKKAAASVPRVLSHMPPVCHIVGFGDSSVDYILRFWITDPRDGLTNIRGNVYLALWDIFKENDISIPFPQREVKILNSESPPNVVDSLAQGAD